MSWPYEKKQMRIRFLTMVEGGDRLSKRLLKSSIRPRSDPI